MHVQNFGGKTKSMVVFLKLAYWYIDTARCVAICKTVGQLFKRRLGRVLRKCVLCHFSFGERFYVNTLYCDSLSSAYNVDKKNICL